MKPPAHRRRGTRRGRHRPRRRPRRHGGSDASGDPVTLTFQSLAYQDTTVAATEDIVDAWNKANPDIQVELRQGSWDNVHDQLVTQFPAAPHPTSSTTSRPTSCGVRRAGLPRRPHAST